MEKVVVIGVGMMGPGIAAVSALAGDRTILVHSDPDRALGAVARANEHIDQLANGGLAGPEAATRAKSLVESEVELESAVRGADLIVEAVTENLRVKQRLFARLDELADPSAIITSNTSGLRITEIAKRMKHPERAATTHFWFPAHLVPLVEVVMGNYTSADTSETLRRVLNGWGKSPVIVKRDLPGQLANRILQAIIREAVSIVDSGLASADDVDTAIKAGMAIRLPVWGPLEHIDAVGLDLALSVQRDVLPGLNNKPGPSGYLESLCANGDLGAKTGKGFYDWSLKSMPKLAACRDTFIMETVRLLKSMRERGECP